MAGKPKASPPPSSEDEDVNKQLENLETQVDTEAETAKVEAYIKANPGYPHETILLTSDGVFFADTVKGENACKSYCGKDKTFVTYKVK